MIGAEVRVVPGAILDFRPWKYFVLNWKHTFESEAARRIGRRGGVKVGSTPSVWQQNHGNITGGLARIVQDDAFYNSRICSQDNVERRIRPLFQVEAAVQNIQVAEPNRLHISVLQASGQLYGK